jgi:hypothetical protein
MNYRTDIRLTPCSSSVGCHENRKNYEKSVLGMKCVVYLNIFFSKYFRWDKLLRNYVRDTEKYVGRYLCKVSVIDRR